MATVDGVIAMQSSDCPTNIRITELDQVELGNEGRQIGRNDRPALPFVEALKQFLGNYLFYSQRFYQRSSWCAVQFKSKTEATLGF